MTGWMDTAIGITSPAIAATQAAIATIAGGDITTGSASLKADVGLTSDVAPGGGALIDVEIVPPLNTIEVGGVPLATPVSAGLIPQPFNQGTIGLIPFHKNKGDTIDEIVKQGPPAKDPPTDPSRIPEDSKSQIRKYLEDLLKSLTPPSFAYEGPLGGAGFLGLFAPEEGTPEYEAYIAGKKEPASNLNLNPDTPPAENKWNPHQTWGDFLTGFQTGFEKDQEVGFWDMLLGFVNISQWPLMAIAAGGILLVIVILR